MNLYWEISTTSQWKLFFSCLANLFTHLEPTENKVHIIYFCKITLIYSLVLLYQPFHSEASRRLILFLIILCFDLKKIPGENFGTSLNWNSRKMTQLTSHTHNKKSFSLDTCLIFFSNPLVDAYARKTSFPSCVCF